MTRDLTEAEVDSLNREMEDTLTSFHFKDLPTWLTKNIHEETTTKSGDACWFAFKTTTTQIQWNENRTKKNKLCENSKNIPPLSLLPISCLPYTFDVCVQKVPRKMHDFW